jgi:hypothetical protein
MSGPLPDGTRQPGLLITHGAINILVREQGSCVAVFIVVKVPDDVRGKLANLMPEDKQRFYITLRGELSSNSRTAFSFIPQNLGDVGQLEALNIEQLLKISEDDVSSFNRFCDALQEIVTTTVKALSVFGLLASIQEPSTTAVRPASGMLYG